MAERQKCGSYPGNDGNWIPSTPWPMQPDEYWLPETL